MFPILVLLFSASVHALNADLEGLKLVSVVFRHGDRTPISFYPDDPYKDIKFWPEGFGQLTSRGKQRHYHLGQWLRKRYSGFLGERYDPAEIHVRSTDVDRTLMSAESNLAGLYPPVESQVWNEELAWQPIPVHTVPQNEDDLLSSHAECPRFTELQEELLKSKNFSDIYEANRELFEYVSKHTGWNITDVVTLDYIYDTLLIEDDRNLTLPEWSKAVYPGGKFQELRDYSFLVDTYTPELRRLKGGPFLKKLLDDCYKKKNGNMDPAARKFFMYSGHDTTVAPILHTLDVFNPPIAPPYASMIIFELFERDDYYLRISYHNVSGQEPTVLSIPGCTELCPLDQFKELVSPMIPEDWRAECGFKTTNLLENRVTFIAALASSIMAVVVLISVFLLICRKKKEDIRYERIEQGDCS